MKLGTVLLSGNTKDHIQKIISQSPVTHYVVDGTSYDHVKDSTFKREFINNIRGTLDEKLLYSSTEFERNISLDEELYDEFIYTQNTDPLYKQRVADREKLPAHQKKDQILELINKNQVVVISGETGCGKTTQVPQFILDDCLLKRKGSMCRIVCTQPRRISAISIAERVAYERSESLGISAGYSIRLERRPPRDRASIIFCTTGIVLRQLECDASLKSISHLIIDEIHERDVQSDFLLCVVKQIITIRQDLKVILMSATLNAEAFSTYYNNAPHLTIPGFTYPVKEFYLEHVIERLKYKYKEKECRSYQSGRKERKKFEEQMAPSLRQLQKDFSKNTVEQLQHPMAEKVSLDLIYELIVDICAKEEDKGAILVFLTGISEISSLIKRLETSGKFPSSRYIIIPLHSQLSTVSQRQVFDPAPKGKRKIVVSTNIAETSITINDVVYVIDCGKIKMTNFDPRTNTQTLLPEWVASANAAQRKGRAGRVQAGQCFHLFSSARNMCLDPFQKPEILRKRLEDVILSAKLLQVGKVLTFFSKLLDSPELKAVETSLDLLARMNAIDEEENLTPLGYHLAKLPIGAQVGKMILFGAIFSCLDPILSVAASLDFKDAFTMQMGDDMNKKLFHKKLELADGEKSDHIVSHRVLSMFEETYSKRAFCNEYFLNYHTIVMLLQLKNEFMRHLYDMKFVPNMDPKCAECNVNSNNVSLIKAIICAGLYPNVAIARPKKNNFILKLTDDKRVKFHPQSLFNTKFDKPYFNSPLLVYHKRLKSSADFIYDATMVHPLPMIFFGDCYKRVTKSTGSMISIGDNLCFICSKSTLSLIEELRNRLNWFLEYKITHPGVVDWTKTSKDVVLLEAIQKLITDEDLGDLEYDAYHDYDKNTHHFIEDSEPDDEVEPRSSGADEDQLSDDFIVLDETDEDIPDDDVIVIDDDGKE